MSHLLCLLYKFMYSIYISEIFVKHIIFVPFGVVDTNLLTLLVLFQGGQASFIPYLEMCILVSDDCLLWVQLHYHLND